MTLASHTGSGLDFVKRDQRWADLERLRSGNPMYDATIEEIDGRRIRVGDHWLADFASCNYLGFDLEPEIVDAIDVQVRRWGTHPSWSRLLGNPALYPPRSPPCWPASRSTPSGGTRSAPTCTARA
jgi:8-amino-7-oxononanoate synthase